MPVGEEDLWGQRLGPWRGFGNGCGWGRTVRTGRRQGGCSCTFTSPSRRGPPGLANSPGGPHPLCTFGQSSTISEDVIFDKVDMKHKVISLTWRARRHFEWGSTTATPTSFASTWNASTGPHWKWRRPPRRGHGRFGTKEFSRLGVRGKCWE